MTKSRNVSWYTHAEDSEFIGSLPTEITDAGDFICPKCGKEATRWEGTLDQDRMGNDIRGWSYDCFPCGIGSEAEEF